MLLFSCLVLAACGGPPTPPVFTPSPTLPSGAVLLTPSPSATIDPNPVCKFVDEAGQTVQTRFVLPEGFVRDTAEEGSFGSFSRGLALQPHGTVLLDYSGSTKALQDYEAIITMPALRNNLFQSAQAAYRLQALYFYANQQYSSITFPLMNGFAFSYDRWRDGERLGVAGNAVYWTQQAEAETSMDTLESYLQQVNNYCNITTLSGRLKKNTVDDLQMGDLLFRMGDAMHCATIVDTATNPQTGERIFMLAQGCNPAVGLYIVRNSQDASRSPWFSLDQSGWIINGATFRTSDLYAFKPVE